MNQEKIGKFISSERKKKKLTQMDLAEKIGVSNSAVSKWETGNGMPDYSVFSNLCMTLDITINELLSGERNTKDNNVFSEYMKIRDKKNKTKIILVLIISLLIILCFVFGTFFFNSYKSITMYEFIGGNDNFRYDSATYLESKIKTVFTGGQFKIVNPSINEQDIIDKKLVIKENDKYYWFGQVYPGSLSYENYLYGDSFTVAELRHLPKDLYLIVWYRFDGEIVYDVIKLEYKEILSNDKLVDIKTENIADKPNVKLDNEINLNKYAYFNEYKNYLLDQGFKESKSCKKIDEDKECTLLDKIIGDETITIDYLEKRFSYENEGESLVRTYIGHCYEEGPFCYTANSNRIFLHIYEEMYDGTKIYNSHFYLRDENTIDFQKIDKDNEKYMVHFNRFIELFEKYRPQDE